MSTKKLKTSHNETFCTPNIKKILDNDLEETQEYRSNLFASEKQEMKVGQLLNPEVIENIQTENNKKDDVTYASELIDDIVPEYYIAQERKRNGAHWMCRFYAHHIACPNEDIKTGKECFNQHCPKIREAHDAILLS